MAFSQNIKIASLATTALLASAAALAPAQAGDFDVAAYPVVIEAPLTADAAAHAVDHADQKNRQPVQFLAIFAAAAGALAGLFKVFGAKKLARAAASGAASAARASGAYAGAAVKAVGRAVASPLRFALIVAGLAFFALAGVGFYNIEWIGGLLAGAALSGAAAYGMMKSRRALSLRPLAVKRDQSK